MLCSKHATHSERHPRNEMLTETSSRIPALEKNSLLQGLGPPGPLVTPSPPGRRVVVVIGWFFFKTLSLTLHPGIGCRPDPPPSRGGGIVPSSRPGFPWTQALQTGDGVAPLSIHWSSAAPGTAGRDHDPLPPNWRRRPRPGTATRCFPAAPATSRTSAPTTAPDRGSPPSAIPHPTHLTPTPLPKPADAQFGPPPDGAHWVAKDPVVDLPNDYDYPFPNPHPLSGGICQRQTPPQCAVGALVFYPI